jgi:hypothetical protein
MKNLLLFFLTLISSILFSQGNLQFNQVLTLNNGVSYTVPQGKVWKVESAVYTNYYMDYSSAARVLIDNTPVELIPFSFNVGNGPVNQPISTAFPMWLRENSTIQPQQKVAKMFVIEFNIIP